MTSIYFLPDKPPNSSWVELADNYYFFSIDKRDYYAASAFCRSMGSELASIHSTFETSLLYIYMYVTTKFHNEDEKSKK